MSTCPYCHYWSAGCQTRLPDWYIEAEAYPCCLRASAAEIRRVFNTKYGPTKCYISAGYINVDCLIGILKREATSRYAAKFVVARGKPVH